MNEQVLHIQQCHAVPHRGPRGEIDLKYLDHIRKATRREAAIALAEQLLEAGLIKETLEGGPMMCSSVLRIEGTVRVC